ncbi:MAG: porin [Sedimenticola sp.]|nr:porin [Sedimenticola sp.]
MKKLILATTIATLATAGAANAATIYEGKGLTYKLKGDWQIQLRKDTGNNQEWDVEFDDLEIKNSVVYDLNDNMRAFGQLDFGFKDAAEDKQSGSDLEEAYIGLGFNNLSVAVGKMNFASDEFGVEQAYELKFDEDSFDTQGTNGDDVIRLDYALDNLLFVASAELEAQGESSQNGKYFDLFLGGDLGGLELAAAYQTKEATPLSASVDTWGVSAAYDFGMVKLLADYSVIEDTSAQYNLAATFKVAKTTKVALGLVNVDPDNATDNNEWYANVTYKFPSQKNVSLFAEIADTDESNVEMGMLTGMRIKF